MYEYIYNRVLKKVTGEINFSGVLCRYSLQGFF